MSSFLLLLKLFGQCIDDLFLLGKGLTHQSSHLSISNSLLESQFLIDVYATVFSVWYSIGLFFIVSLLIQDARQPLDIIGLQHNSSNLNLAISSRFAVVPLLGVVFWLSSLLLLQHYLVVFHRVVLEAVVVG